MKRSILTALPALAAAVTFLPFSIARADSGSARLFWTDKDAGTLEASDLDGGNRVTLLNGLNDPRGIAVDTVNNKVYWANHGAAGSIFTADCEGGNVTPLLTFLPEPTDVALDHENGVLYWAEEGANRICRASLTPPLISEIVIEGLNRPYYIAIDPAGGFLYWSDFDSGIIHRSTIDGANAADFITGQSRVRDIELSGGKIYWCDRDSSQIRSRDLAGAGAGTVLFSGTADSLDRPHGLVLDPDAGTMYWTDTRTVEVNRAAMDGSGSVTTLVSTGLIGAWGIDLSKPTTGTDPYQDWLPSHFSAAELANPANEATLWDEIADPDLDGLLNLFEFAQGSDPRDPSQNGANLQIALIEESGQRHLEIVFRFRKDDPALSFTVESSRDLDLGQSGWQADQFTEILPRTDDPADAAYEFVTMRSGDLDEEITELFSRLRVSR